MKKYSKITSCKKLPVSLIWTQVKRAGCHLIASKLKGLWLQNLSRANSHLLIPTWTLFWRSKNQAKRRNSCPQSAIPAHRPFLTCSLLIPKKQCCRRTHGRKLRLRHKSMGLASNSKQWASRFRRCLRKHSSMSSSKVTSSLSLKASTLSNLSHLSWISLTSALTQMKLNYKTRKMMNVMRMKTKTSGRLRTRRRFC